MVTCVLIPRDFHVLKAHAQGLREGSTEQQREKLRAGSCLSRGEAHTLAEGDRADPAALTGWDTKEPRELCYAEDLLLRLSSSWSKK